MTTATEAALPTPKKIEQMNDHERLVALRLLDRRKSKVSKLWNGKVSEARTSAEHLVEAEVPKRDAECRQRLEAIKTALDECDDMKSKRKTALDAIKSAWNEILYAAPATAEQLELGATRAPITKVAIVELRAAYNDAVADDAAAQEKGETPKLPPEKAADMDNLRATLDAMLASSGLEDISFGDEITADQTDPDAEVDEDDDDDDDEEEKPAANTGGRGSSKGRGKAKLSAVPTHCPPQMAEIYEEQGQVMHGIRDEAAAAAERAEIRSLLFIGACDQTWCVGLGPEDGDHLQIIDGWTKYADLPAGKEIETAAEILHVAGFRAGMTLDDAMRLLTAAGVSP